MLVGKQSSKLKNTDDPKHSHYDGVISSSQEGREKRWKLKEKITSVKCIEKEGGTKLL